MINITNPILPGFNPDPSIVRVGNDFFIATSTFEWFPGIQIHHSTDLANWKLISQPLNRIEQANLSGVPDSCGIWAPCFTYHEGTFYLVYSLVRSFDGPWKDTPNYLVTTNDVLGDWSDPIPLGGYGFDGSLFHEDNGKKWFVSMLMEHRSSNFFGGIVIREYDEDRKALVGPLHHIFDGTELNRTEAPHIIQKDGFYYLMTAEGGTEFEHAVTIARAKSLFGPYEVHPDNPILSSAAAPKHPLQRTGHADLVHLSSDEWAIVFLSGRPLTERGYCTLGRETSIEEVIWPAGDWPRLKTGSRLARVAFDIQENFSGTATANNATMQHPINNDSWRIDNGNSNSMKRKNGHNNLKVDRELVHFDGNPLPMEFQSLRRPITEDWCSLQERKGWLRIRGQDSLHSTFKQSLIARRVDSFHIQATICLDFQPDTFQQMAGLVFYYNTTHWHYACVSADNYWSAEFAAHDM